MDLAAPHLGYVIFAYAISAVVLAGLIGAVVLDLARQKRATARLDADGAGGRPRRRAANDAEHP